MLHRPHTAPERTSFGMGVAAVAFGVGFGFADSIARRAHRHDDRADTETRRVDLPWRVDTDRVTSRERGGAQVSP